MRFEQCIHVALKPVPLERSISAGKEVNPTLLQPYHAMPKSVPLERSILAGKEVKPVHECQQLLKIVPLDKSKAGNSVSEVQFFQLP